MGFFDLLSGRVKKGAKTEPAMSKHFQTFLEQGKIELESKDFGKSLEYFDKAIIEAEKTKENPIENAYVCKARALDGLKRYNESEKLYDKAFELKPDDPSIWLMRGLSYAEQGMNEKAVRYYDKSFELNPMMEDAMLAKAMLYGRLGQQDKQIECYQKILQANSENRKAKQQIQKIQDERKKQTNRQWLEGITKKMKSRGEDESKNQIKLDEEK